GYTGGRPRPRGDGAGMGIRSTSLIKVTSKDSCSNIGDLRTRWLGEPLCYGGSRARERAGAAPNYDHAPLRETRESILTLACPSVTLSSYYFWHWRLESLALTWTHVNATRQCPCGVTYPGTLSDVDNAAPRSGYGAVRKRPCRTHTDAQNRHFLTVGMA